MLSLLNNVFSSIWKRYIDSSKEFSVLILGTPTSGKTSLFNHLKELTNLNQSNLKSDLVLPVSFPSTLSDQISSTTFLSKQSENQSGSTKDKYISNSLYNLSSSDTHQQQQYNESNSISTSNFDISQNENSNSLKITNSIDQKNLNNSEHISETLSTIKPNISDDQNINKILVTNSTISKDLASSTSIIKETNEFHSTFNELNSHKKNIISEDPHFKNTVHHSINIYKNSIEANDSPINLKTELLPTSSNTICSNSNFTTTWDSSSVGVNFSKLNFPDLNVIFHLTDLCGSMKSCWTDYVTKSDIILYIIDSSNLDLLTVIRKELPILIDFIISNTPSPHPEIIFVSNAHFNNTHYRIIHELNNILKNKNTTSSILTFNGLTGAGTNTIAECIAHKANNRWLIQHHQNFYRDFDDEYNINRPKNLDQENDTKQVNAFSIDKSVNLYHSLLHFFILSEAENQNHYQNQL